MAVPAGKRAQKAVLALCRDQPACDIFTFDAHKFPADGAVGLPMTVSDIAHTGRTGWRMPGGMLGTILRYGLSASGPVAVSAAHFLASLIFLRSLPAHEFGLFSFVMVVVSFGMSLNVSLIVVPITRNLVTGEAVPRQICFQMNWLVCGGFAALLFAALLVGGAPLREATLLALFAGAFTFRWF